MWGFHFQRPVQGWLDAVQRLPAGAPVKSVNDVHLLRDAKGANSAVYTVLRYHDDGNQHYGDVSQEQREIWAAQYFAKFIDATFLTLAQYVDAVALWNEEYAASQTPQERQWRVLQDRAFITVWLRDHHHRFPWMDLHLTSAAPGNSIPVGIAQLAHQYRVFSNLGDGGVAMDYHAYTGVHGGQVVPGENIWCSCRWIQDDALYRQSGYYPRWFLSEIGATGWNDGSQPAKTAVAVNGFYRGWEPPVLPEMAQKKLGVQAVAGFFDYGGWKDGNVYGGNLTAYENGAILDNLTRWGQWAQDNPGRFLGGAAFTINGRADSRWLSYEMDGGELANIADFVRANAGNPPPPPPPPGGGVEEAIWNNSVSRQIERGIPLNPHAGLQQLIFARPGYTPVTREETVQVGADVYGYMAGEHVGGSGPRLVWYFKKPWPGPGQVHVMDEP